ncbi:MFS transporter [Serratia nevei]|uniref:MFS transporter n=1 Tax=Serratia nevei TaxID=2703794 RepID=UPI00209F1115|nr:MFS transporter [Serratia nevei]MCP1104927.1 MFS transporter [Serratia nevei]
MSALFFFMLFCVMTADGLMVFLTPVLVYQLTGSIEYSGLSYALWWLPRILIIPFIGKYIDQLGVRPLSISSDLIKSAGCLFLAFSSFSSDLSVAVAFGIVGSIISIGNSQTIISYEKLVSTLSNTKEHHANLISRMDFFGMVAGPLIGMALIEHGYRMLLILPCILYVTNALFFILKKKDLCYTHIEKDILSADKDDDIDNKFIQNARIVILSPVLVLSIFLAAGNNMFDGLVESSGTALIDRVMGMHIKYFGLIDVAAGIFGVVGTYLYSSLNTMISRKTMLILSVITITASSLFMLAYPSLFPIFVGGYALSITGKVFTGNICRMIRIETINPSNFAGASSIIVLLNQSVLPVIGLIIYFSGDSTSLIYIFMLVSVTISFAAGMLLFRNIIPETEKPETSRIT